MAVAHRTDTLVIFVNQMRTRVGVVFGSPETTTGGNALRFYASVRLDVRRIGHVKVDDQAVGSRTRVKVVKNKLAVPFQEAELDIRWGQGIDKLGDLLDVAVDRGAVEKSGVVYSMGGQVIGLGREKAREELGTRPGMAEAVRDLLGARRRIGDLAG